jgi:hypothetical protein
MGVSCWLGRILATSLAAEESQRAVASASVSTACGPVLLHPGDGLVFAHRCHVSLAEANSGQEQVHQVCGQCSRWRLRYAAAGFGSVLDACPERRLVDIELIFQDVAPDARAVRVPVPRVGYPRSQDPAVMELELVSDVMRSGPTPRCPYRLPPFGLTESLMRLARRRRPGQWADPASHSRSCSSSLRLISCTRLQFSR